MDAIITGIVAVAGTLLGSITTHLLERRTLAARAEIDRHDRLRQEQLVACSAYAGSLAELKRAVITLWFQRHRPEASEEKGTAWLEADRLGAAAEGARFRMILVLDDPGLTRLADEAFATLRAIHGVPRPDGLPPAEEAFAAAVEAFIAAASRALRAEGPDPSRA